MKELKVNGRSPVNPMGSCFDATAQNFLLNSDIPTAVICHGVGTANAPGQEGVKIAHAWVELYRKRELYVIDCIWMVAIPYDKYYEDLKIEYVVRYGREEFLKLWQEKGFPGPYDSKVAAYTIEGKAKAKSAT